MITAEQGAEAAAESGLVNVRRGEHEVNPVRVVGQMTTLGWHSSRIVVGAITKRMHVHEPAIIALKRCLCSLFFEVRNLFTPIK